MTDASWTRLADLVADALDRPPAERAAFLDAGATGADGAPDAALRAEATALVAAAEAAETTGALASPVAAVAAPMPGAVGPWQITGVLGQGGMGVVYAGERTGEGFTQRAAVKCLRLAADAAFRARFVRERALLAKLDHPAVARLLDGGLAPDGTPYLAMERVDGTSLPAYAETHALDVPARLALFLDAADAVAYAHRHLVVHRDLKPAHIVVDGDGRVRLLDFGIAKLLDAPDDGLDTRTTFGPLTPQYAAPEQLRGGAVTTATDVYALGLVLYETLAGARPYAVGGATPAETERLVCHAEPAPPSAAAPPERARALRGDLDTVVAKALAKKPGHRYASAEALAADVRRFLDGRPVEARPATAGYRVRRFVRRNYGTVAASAATVLFVTALVAFYTLRLADERDRARAAEAAARTAEATARDEADRATATARFLEQILLAPNPRWYAGGARLGPDAPIRDVLAVAAERAEQEFATRPALLADLHRLLSEAYAGMGLRAEARHHTRRVLELRRQLLAPPHPELAEALFYAAYYEPTPRAELAMHQRALAMLRARPEGNNYPFVVEAVAAAWLEAGRTDSVAAIADEGYRYAARTFVPGHDGYRYRTQAMLAMTSLATQAHLARGETADAGRAFARLDSLVRRLPPTADYAQHWPLYVLSAGRLALARGQAARAERLLRQCAGDAPFAGSPFPGVNGLLASPDPGVPTRTRATADACAAGLERLYRAQNRSADAARVAARAARHRATRDSIRALYAR